MIKHHFAMLLLLCSISSISQNITGRVIDSENGLSMAFANISINGKQHILSNAEGYFSIPDATDDMQLTVSFLGYYNANLTVAQLKKDNFIVALRPGVYELENVYISNIEINADSIMAKVKKKLPENYKWTDGPVKKTVFYREGISIVPQNLNIKMKSSTGHGKYEIEEANKHLGEFTSKLIKNPPSQYSEMLGNYYLFRKTVKGKPSIISKFEIDKAVKLMDENRSVSINELQEQATAVLNTHIDTTKYYRIKSGLFGTRDTVLSPKIFQKRASSTTGKLNTVKADVRAFMAESNLRSSRFDFINHQEIYEYNYVRRVEAENKDFIYIIKFRPKHRNAKYTGTLYVSESDYAVIRAEYTLAEGKKTGGVNLKFLLGIKQSENVSRGTLLYKKKKSEQDYYLQYASRETGSYIYINRPLKLIEITEGDKESVGFKMKIEMDMLNTNEYLSISENELTETEFDKVKEQDFNYLRLKSYDPDLWKENNVVEPLEEMKQFKTVN